MFPTIRVSFSGLERKKRYAIGLDVVSVDNKRYRYAYHRSSWLVAGKADPPAPYRLYTHPGEKQITPIIITRAGGYCASNKKVFRKLVRKY